MSGILASMIDGVLVGAVYGLAAMGLSLIWGVMDVINLTHGAMIALGMFCMYLLFGAFGGNAYVLLLPYDRCGIDSRTCRLLDGGALGSGPLHVDEPAVYVCGEHDGYRHRHRGLQHQPV